MATKTSIGGAYPVQAPLLSDNANVIEAIRLYHLGEGGTEGSPSDDSITKHLSIKANIASPNFTGTITSTNVTATANVNAVTVNATTNVVTVTVNATVVNAITSVNTATVNATTANVTTLNVTNINGGTISSSTVATTQAATDSSTKIATTKFVNDFYKKTSAKYKSGFWYDTAKYQYVSYGFTGGRLYYYPFIIESDLSITSIALYQDGGTTSTSTFAIYDDNGSMYPGNLVASLGSITATTAGAKYNNSASATITTPGVYWMCVYISASVTYYAYVSPGLQSYAETETILGAGSAFSDPPVGGFGTPTSFTSFPSTFSSIAGITGWNSATRVPRIQIQIT